MNKKIRDENSLIGRLGTFALSDEFKTRME